jgi:hypothetical protein
MFDNCNFISTVIGVFIGWLLTEVSSYLRNRYRDKRSIREAIYTSYELRFRLQQMIPILKAASESNLNSVNNQKMIKAMMEDEKENINNLITDIKSSIKTISVLDPFLALELNIAMNKDFYFGKYGPVEKAINTKEYIDLQLKLCVTYEKYIGRIIKKLLWSNDKINFIKFIYRDKKDSKKSIDWSNLFSK